MGWIMVAGLHAETRMVAGQRAVPNFVFLAAAIRETRGAGLEVQKRGTREMTRRAGVGLEVQKRGTREMTRRAGGEARIMMTRSTAVSVQGKFWRRKFWRTAASQLVAGITCANFAIRTLLSTLIMSKKAMHTWIQR
jgi:hypothetical protein